MMVLVHAAIAFWHYFHPQITKNMDLETISHFATPNLKKITELCPKWIPGGTPKIDKN